MTTKKPDGCRMTHRNNARVFDNYLTLSLFYTERFIICTAKREREREKEYTVFSLNIINIAIREIEVTN